jgi:hypothetical protein
MLGNAPMDWTVSPRVFAGYRLPSGFGEFMVSYRYFGTVGSTSLPGASGSTALNSRLAFDMIDLDYNSRELSLWPQWDMKWTTGLRLMSLFFDNAAARATQTAGAGGSTQASEFNNLFGLGPHAAVGLSRRLGDSGLSFFAWGDVATLFTYNQQGWLDRTIGPNGMPLPGETRAFGHQESPMINFRTGVVWQPSPASFTRVFLGYQYEYFWALNRVPSSGPNPPSTGQLNNQGLVIQATLNY